jgi:regulator of protease activity HflC (stomatin/prohibitin superfamily)
MSDHASTTDGLPTEAEVRGRYGPAFHQARRFVGPLGALSLTFAGAAALLVVLVPPNQSPACCAAAALLLVAAAAAGAATAVAELRARSLSAALAELDQALERRRRAEEGTSLFAPRTYESVDALARPPADADVSRYCRTHLPLGLAAAALGTGGVAVLGLLTARAGAPGPAYFAVGFTCLALAFVALFAGRWIGAQPEEELPEARPLSALLWAAQWSVTLTGVALLGRALGFPMVDLWVGRALLVLALVMSAESLLRASAAPLRSLATPGEARIPLGTTVADSLLAGTSPLASTLDLVESRFGVSVRSSYVIGYVGQTLPWVLGGMVALMWLTTSLVCIKPDEAGVLRRFGSIPRGAWLGPGLHLKAPWPVDRVETVQMTRVRRLVLGRDSDSDLSFILWSRSHAKDEYKLVLGDGRELVSLDAMVFYRVKDPVAFTTQYANPVAALSSLAYRQVIQQVVSSDLEHILSRARDRLCKELRAALQRDADERRLGIEVVDVLMGSIHPPVEVAQSYQAVVSAQVEKTTLMIRAQGDREAAIPAAEAERHAAVCSARGKAATRTSAARGEAIRFESVEAAYAANPALYRQRLWLETLERCISGKRLFVVPPDHEGEGEYWVDFRAAAGASGG